jgi:hypothetical protein
MVQEEPDKAFAEWPDLVLENLRVRCRRHREDYELDTGERWLWHQLSLVLSEAIRVHGRYLATLPPPKVPKKEQDQADTTSPPDGTPW